MLPASSYLPELLRRHTPGEESGRRLMFIPSLMDPAIGLPHRPARPRPAPHHVHPSETQAIAECFISARTRTDPLVALAYQQLELQTDRQFAALTRCSAVSRVALTTGCGRCMISSGTSRTATASTGMASTQPGSRNAASTQVWPAGPPLRSCTAKSVRCGLPASSRSTRRCCSTVTCLIPAQVRSPARRMIRGRSRRRWHRWRRRCRTGRHPSVPGLRRAATRRPGGDCGRR